MEEDGGNPMAEPGNNAAEVGVGGEANTGVPTAD